MPAVCTCLQSETVYVYMDLHVFTHTHIHVYIADHMLMPILDKFMDKFRVQIISCVKLCL